MNKKAWGHVPGTPFEYAKECLNKRTIVKQKYYRSPKCKSAFHDVTTHFLGSENLAGNIICVFVLFWVMILTPNVMCKVNVMGRGVFLCLEIGEGEP